MLKKTFFIFVLSLFFSSVSFAQNVTYTEAIEKGRSFTKLGNYQKAVAYLKMAKQMKPSEHLPCQLAGIAFYKAGNYKQAKSEFESSKKLFADDYVSETYLGNICIKEGQFDKAAIHLKKSSEMAPEYPYAQIALGFLHIKQKDLSKGRVQMRKALNATLDDDVEVYKTIGAIYTAEKMPKDAIYTYNKYIETCGDTIPKDYAAINYLLAKVYDSQKNPRAETAYRIAFESDGKNVGYAQGFANYLFRKNKINDSYSVYVKAVKIAKLTPENYYNLGLIYFNKKEIKLAVKYLELADRGKKNFTLAKIALSAGYLRIGEYDKCILKNNEIIKADPAHETAWYNSACAYAKKGNRSQALKHLKRAIELNPENKKFAKEESMFSKLAKDAEFLNLTKNH